VRRLGPVRTGMALAAACMAGACGSSGSSANPNSPTAPGAPSGPACRTYPTSTNVTTRTSNSNFVFNAILTGNFDTSTKQATVQTKFANGTVCATGVASYNSIADFVNEVRVIPPVFLATGTTNQNSAACGGAAAAGSLTYQYDGQRRLTGMTTSLGVVTTYTAWDSQGRPTTGSDNKGGTISFSYDDAARTQVQTQNPGNTVSTSVFDTNGILVSIAVTAGGITSTTTFAVNSTATVCK
jgi:YD repeat-containing protein